MHRWELKFEDSIFALTSDEIALSDIRDEDMKLAAALVVDRVNYVSSLSTDDARKTFASFQLTKIDELRTTLKDRIEDWQANNWRRADVKI